jgi:hypothetical protein
MAELREEVRKSDEAAVFFEERAKQYRAMFEHAEVEARADPLSQPNVPCSHARRAAAYAADCAQTPYRASAGCGADSLRFASF